jgi:hypothetical protein
MFRVIFFLVCFFTLNAIVEVIAANADRRAFIRARSGTVVGDLDRHTHRSATEILYNRRFLCNRLCVIAFVMIGKMMGRVKCQVWMGRDGCAMGVSIEAIWFASER